MRTPRTFPGIIVLLAFFFVARNGIGADELLWTFKEGAKPAVFKVKIEHEEKGENPLWTSLWMKWRTALQEVAPDGEGRWTLKVERVKVTLRRDGATLLFDSSKEGPGPEARLLKPFAELVGAEVTIRVSRKGEVRALAGAFSGRPSPGGLEIGKDPGTSLARGMALEAMTRLFRLPMKAGSKGGASRVYSFGATGTMPGISAFVLALGEGVKASKHNDAKAKGFSCKAVKASTRLYSYESEISMGGPSLKIRDGQVGEGSVAGKYALESGYTIHLVESREYSLPLPSGAVKFARTLYIEFLRKSDLSVGNESEKSPSVRKAVDLIEREGKALWRIAHPTVLKYDELRFDGSLTWDKAIQVRFTYFWGKKGHEHETTIGFRFDLEGTLSGIDAEDVVQPLADSSNSPPFLAATIAARLLRAELKRRIAKLDLSVDDELKVLVNRKLTAKGIAGLWLKFRVRFPKD